MPSQTLKYGVSMNPSAIFDINSDEAFFRSLCRAAEELKASKVKSTDCLLYLIMGLNHLREWIAPEFGPNKQKPITHAEKFYVALWKIPEFKIINAICNRSKHMATISFPLEVQYGANFDDWPDFDSVNDFDCGPPLAYFADGRNLMDVIDVVICFYKKYWYCPQSDFSNQ